MNKSTIVPILALLLIGATATPLSLAGSPSPVATYTAPATVVVGEAEADTNDTSDAIDTPKNFDTADLDATDGSGRAGARVDEGFVRCGATTGSGEGGFCLHDPWTEAVYVHDDALGPAFAFQVCRDSDLDRQCTDEETHFSHGNDGTYQNPVDVPGMPGVGQVVVFLCIGVHEAGGAHPHTATTGFGTSVPDPRPGILDGFTASGGFCGGGTVGKQYVITREL